MVVTISKNVRGAILVVALMLCTWAAGASIAHGDAITAFVPTPRPTTETSQPQTPRGEVQLGSTQAPQGCPAGQFCPLADVTGSSKAGNLYSSGSSPSKGIADYVNNVFTLSISIAGILAVIRIAWAGYLYMASEMWTDKGHAREVLRDSLLGLLLVLATWVILRQINPQILNLNFDIRTPAPNPTATGAQSVDESGFENISP